MFFRLKYHCIAFWWVKYISKHHHTSVWCQRSLLLALLVWLGMAQRAQTLLVLMLIGRSKNVKTDAAKCVKFASLLLWFSTLLGCKQLNLVVILLTPAKKLCALGQDEIPTKLHGDH